MADSERPGRGAAGTAAGELAEKEPLFLDEGTMIGGRYEVQGPLPGDSPEADPYLCSSRGQLYVAKVFRAVSQMNSELAGDLTRVESPFIARCFRTGVHHGHPYEIYPYYRDGSIADEQFTYEEMRDSLIPAVNRGLRALHAKSIVDTDLKAGNVMRSRTGSRYAITDYGRMAVNACADKSPPGSERAPWYTAPELLQGRPEPASDYYSLGIMLYRLFTGRLPFDGVPAPEMERCIVSGLFPYPQDMPVRLQHLIAGLTFREAQAPGGRQNANRRWGYNEVRRWCEGEDPLVPVSPENRGITLSPYVFRNRPHRTVSELAESFAEHWTEGKEELFSGRMSDFFAGGAPEVEEICARAEREVRTKPRSGDIVFFRTLYELSPVLGNLYWKGKNLGSPAHVGKQLMEDAAPDALDEMIRQGATSSFVQLKRPDEPDAYRVVQGAEQAYAHASSEAERRRQQEVIGRILGRDYTYTNDGKTFRNIEDFAHWCLAMRQRDPDAWETLAKSLVPAPGVLRPDFESWLEASGGQDAVRSWSAGRGRETAGHGEPLSGADAESVPQPQDGASASEDAETVGNALRATSRKRGLR